MDEENRWKLLGGHKLPWLGQLASCSLHIFLCYVHNLLPLAGEIAAALTTEAGWGSACSQCQRWTKSPSIMRRRRCLSCGRSWMSFNHVWSRARTGQGNDRRDVSRNVIFWNEVRYWCLSMKRKKKGDMNIVVKEEKMYISPTLTYYALPQVHLLWWATLCHGTTALRAHPGRYH